MDKKELLDFIDSRIKYNHEQGIKYQNAECELVLIREEIEKELEENKWINKQNGD